MVLRLATMVAVMGLGGCAVAPAADAPLVVRVTPDNPERPRVVRIEAPTAALIGLPGQYPLPVTGQARLSTRAIAAHELAERGYCPNGFEGPEGVHFSEDRAHAAFVVRCR